jgi:hypothetical protein
MVGTLEYLKEPSYERFFSLSAFEGGSLLSVKVFSWAWVFK